MDDLEQRLRDLGRQPVDPRLAADHLSAMRERPRWRFGWRAVAAAGVVGFLAGGTGLAAAGTLPDPAQDVAHDVLGAVGVNVPRSTDGCPDNRPYRNHGEYVSEVEAAGGDVEAAAKSDCGKPAHSGGASKGNGAGRRAGQPRADADGDPCTGPPLWAGAHLPAADKERLQAQRLAACPDDTDADAGERQVAPAEEPATTTTTTTTTTTPTTTTTTTG